MRLVAPQELRRCVGFSWAKPSVTKRATHPSVYRVETYAGIAHASQKRGQSVSDGVSRASLGVLAFPTLASLLQRSQRPVGILGGETAKQHLPSAELRDGPRLASSRFKTN